MNATANEANWAALDLVITRTVNARRELVYRAWTDPLQMAAWWGPREFTNPVCELDVRPGGAIRIDMRAPDGTVYPMKGTFNEIVPQQRLVFTSTALEDEQGNPQHENVNFVTFVGLGDKTKIILMADVRKTSPEARKALDGMPEGWYQSFDRLEELLAKS
jgi:uncharacterized protein YndB with AHSA1/START domain